MLIDYHYNRNQTTHITWYSLRKLVDCHQHKKNHQSPYQTSNENGSVFTTQPNIALHRHLPFHPTRSCFHNDISCIYSQYQCNIINIIVINRLVEIYSNVLSIYSCFILIHKAKFIDVVIYIILPS
jgi:hypothetical protein